MNAEVVTLEGCKVAHRRIGSGPPMVLLHGIAGSDWPEDLLAALAAKHELFVPDHPGFGASETPPWLRTMDDMAYFYLSYVQAMAKAPVTLVGHSLGGWIAAEMAIRNADRLSRLVLVAPAGIRKKGTLPGDIFLWNREELMRNLVHDQALAEQRMAKVSTKEEIEIQLKNRYTGARLSWEPRLMNPTLARWAHRIDCPVTLVWGASDKVIPSSYAEVWQEKLPKAKLVTVKDCGHLVHIEKPKELASIILGGAGE